MLVYSTGIARNELIYVDMPMWCILQVHSVYTHMHPHTRMHAHMRAYTHTHILIPFEDCEPMGIKVDVAVNLALSATFFLPWGVGGWG